MAPQFFDNFLEGINYVWIGFVSLSPFEYTYQNFHNKSNTLNNLIVSNSVNDALDVPQKLTMIPTEFLPWFEAQLIEFCSLDLAQLHIEMKLLNGKIKELKHASVAFRWGKN